MNDLDKRREFISLPVIEMTESDEKFLFGI